MTPKYKYEKSIYALQIMSILVIVGKCGVSSLHRLSHFPTNGRLVSVVGHIIPGQF